MMGIDQSSPAADTYQTVLAEYLTIQNEQALYRASLLSKQFVEQGIGPEEIVALHSDSLNTLVQAAPVLERARIMSLSLQFLLEIMITYGIRYKEYLDLRMTEATRAIQMQMEVERLRADEATRVAQARADERMRAEQEALRSKEEFLAFIAHELRNPITAIKGGIELAVRRATQEGSERVQRALSTAEQGLDRLMHLSNELLLLSREEQAELRLDLEPVDSGALLEQTVEAARARARGRHITLKHELPEQLPPVLGDREWLLTMLDNLLDNAIKYTEAGGQVTVRAQAHARRLQIDVEDTGIGIPADALPFVFEKYYRAPTGGGGFVKGSGLGLALVKRIAERHGGDVRVQSEVGQGTTFSVYLPLAVPAPDASGE